MQALRPAWKRGYCTEGAAAPGHPRPTANYGALPAVGYAAACAALRYGVAQGWIQDETTRDSVNVQKAVDRVAHTGQTEVALHNRGRHGGPTEEMVVEPTGMVLVLAADMVPGVVHASRVRRARPHWTIQVYTPPRAWPFSTWAVLVIMWHLAPEGTPGGSPEEIARDLHPGRPTRTSPGADPKAVSQWRPRQRGSALRRPSTDTPTRGARPFLQTGMVPAAPLDSGWKWDAEEAQPLPDPWVPPLWYPPMDALAHATVAVKGAFPPPKPPGAALLRSLQAGAAWVRWGENGRPGPYFPLVQGQELLHAEDMGTVEWGAIVPDTACTWISAAAPQPMLWPTALKPVRTPVAIFGSLGVCIYVPASRHWLISHSPIHLT